jgi:cytochrome c553
MQRPGTWIDTSKVWVLLLVTAHGVALAQEAPLPAPRSIPGINAPDPFPQACVSCHVVLPDGRDVRLSTLVRRWQTGVDSAMLAIAQSAAPAGLTLSGRHPDVPQALSDIPAGCLICHGRSATQAPPFSRLLHRIHLASGETGLFLSMFQGECTFCHKLDKTSGAWSIPSGPEP